MPQKRGACYGPVSVRSLTEVGVLSNRLNMILSRKNRYSWPGSLDTKRIAGGVFVLITLTTFRYHVNVRRRYELLSAGARYSVDRSYLTPRSHVRRGGLLAI